MRTIEYRRWSPLASPVCVEFPAELLLELGWADTSGILYGSRRGREVRVSALRAPSEEAPRKVGVFVSRIRGEVFLTEADLAFLNQQQAGLALVVAGKRAGFFVREPDGSIQTVRSHEEFTIGQGRPPLPGRREKRSWAPAGLLALGVLPLAALAVLPQHAAREAPQSLDVHASGNQLHISWTPVPGAVLTVEDGGSRVSVPVYAEQSTATYAMQGTDVAVSLVSVDPANHLRRESARYVTTVGPAARDQGAK
jgi:hypothetical protein